MISGILKERLVNNNAGSVLVLSLVFSMATIILGAAYLQYSNHIRQEVSYDIAKYKCQVAAHAKTVIAKAYYRARGESVETPRTIFYRDPDDEFVVEFASESISRGGDTTGFARHSDFWIHAKAYVTGWEVSASSTDTDGISDDAYQDISDNSYADWLYITDKETQSYRPASACTLYFWGPDTLDGKVHSNDVISFQSGNGDWPVFEELVTSHADHFNPRNAQNFVHFNGGYLLDYAALEFPLQADSVRKYNAYAEPNLGTTHPDSITEIVLQPDYFLVRHRLAIPPYGDRNHRYFRYDTDTSTYNMSLTEAESYSRYPYPGPESEALFIEGELWLCGPSGAAHFNTRYEPNYIIHGFGGGNLTIAASGDIVIAQDVEYADNNSDGSVPSTCQNTLGLISERHILVWRLAPSTVKINAGLGAIGYSMDMDDSAYSGNKCPDSASVHSSVTGRNGTISIDGINCYGIFNEKQKLWIQGCVIMRERGLVHSHYGTPSKERGYITKYYRYDHRFRYHPPPHFFETFIGTDNYWE
jgi:hypothetical protein